MEHILTLNAGSSSVKFALFEADHADDARLRGQIEGLGATPHLIAKAGGETVADDALSPGETADHAAALAHILGFLEEKAGGVRPVAIGHRVVHGGPHHDAPVVLDDALLAELAGFNPLAPLHQPHNLAAVAAARAAFPDAMQVACFDTAFHRAHPWVADTYALPQSYYEEGIRRYGFHGLSYEHAVETLQAVSPERAGGRTIIAHLGNGASMCATLAGRSVASSMGFTALDGLPMGTRCGQLDPGVVLYLMTEMQMDVAAIETLLYRESGLKGLSGLSHDLRVLEAAATPQTDHAIDYFVHRIRREIGAHAAILGGVDLLAFSGGIGENAARIRRRVCENMEWLGIEIDAVRNANCDERISTDSSAVEVRIVRADEERVIANHCRRFLSPAPS